MSGGPRPCGRGPGRRIPCRARGAHAFVRAVASVRLALVVALALLVSATAAQAQRIPRDRLPEEDNMVFNYSRLELDVARLNGAGVGSWNGEGWVGTDFDRLWWKTEGELVGSGANDAELQLLYGRYVATFWDLQVGYRRDIRPVGNNYLAVGIQGLAPYFFEVAATGFLSDRGKVSARTEVAAELLLSQRLITRPSVSLDWGIVSDRARGIPPGLGDASLGLQTRYEFTRKFAPYADVRWTRRGDAASPGASEDEPTGWSLRGGLWLIF